VDFRQSTQLVCFRAVVPSVGARPSHLTSTNSSPYIPHPSSPPPSAVITLIGTMPVDRDAVLSPPPREYSASPPPFAGTDRTDRTDQPGPSKKSKVTANDLQRRQVGRRGRLRCYGIRRSDASMIRFSFSQGLGGAWGGTARKLLHVLLGPYHRTPLHLQSTITYLLASPHNPPPPAAR
jgi:hypothetical protein